MLLISWTWTIISLSSNITYHQSCAASAATATKPFPSKQACNAFHSSKATALSSYRSAMACSKVMKICIFVIWLLLSHVAMSLAFATISTGLSDCPIVALPGDMLIGVGCGIGFSMKSRTSQCSRAIMVWAFHTFQFEPLSLSHSVLSRSFASSQSIFEGMFEICGLGVLYRVWLMSWAHNLL